MAEGTFWFRSMSVTDPPTSMRFSAAPSFRSAGRCPFYTRHGRQVAGRPPRLRKVEEDFYAGRFKAPRCSACCASLAAPSDTSESGAVVVPQGRGCGGWGWLCCTLVSRSGVGVLGDVLWVAAPFDGPWALVYVALIAALLCLLSLGCTPDQVVVGG